MCLILTVHLDEGDAARVSEICHAAGIQGCSGERRLFTFTRCPSGVIHIPGPEGGCGCSFLADSADWNAMTWDMIPSALPRLAAILRTLRQHTSKGFSFEALWAGERPTQDRRVTVEELVSIVDQSKLGTKIRYLVE